MTLHATYRLQFHKGFTFADAERRTDYFALLGVSHVYSSPILAARAGSVHGYDVVDPARINPELGGEPAFRSLVAALRVRGIGVLLDIVPNHMAVGGAENPYWLDVLEKGRASVFANMFDIDWDLAEETSDDKVVVPMLGKPLAACMSDGDITLSWDARLGKLVFVYGDNRFPLRLDDYAGVIGECGEAAAADVSRFCGGRALASLLARQHYKLVYWKDAGDRINWRRFFDITDLAAVRVEDDAVFETTHAAILRLYAEGLIDGVRVDHVDGLADPAAYCRRLRARLEALMPQRSVELPREPAIVVVEKILADEENLPADWGVDGTTGYDFMNAVSGLQHDPAGESTFTELWTTVSGRRADFDCEERIARADMLDDVFTNALRTAAAAFAALESSSADAEPFERGLHAIIERFRAYRTYALGDNSAEGPGAIFDDAVSAARDDLRADQCATDAVNTIADVLHGAAADSGDMAQDAVRRFNQLAAPVAAKAVEDTALYRYGRLLSRNDVGFSPGTFAIEPEGVHRRNAARAEAFPSALLTTATHDHKRGEDARARLAVLSEIPDQWKAEQAEWFRINDSLRPETVSCADEYQLYQTLVGAWPTRLSLSDADAVARFTDRILAWRVKSLREAKRETSWWQPDPLFEAAHAAFVRRVLDPAHEFIEHVATFVEWLAPAGALNSLTGCVLRHTSPGVPDIYQGTELWDLSLVDPDNRRPVDFELRTSVLRAGCNPADALKDWKTGGAKLAVIHRLLSLRQAMPELFRRGGYQPIHSTDPRLFCFARTMESQLLFVAVPRLCAKDAVARHVPLPALELGRLASIRVLEEWPDRRWKDGLDTAYPDVTMGHELDLFARFPAAVLFSSSELRGTFG